MSSEANNISEEEAELNYKALLAHVTKKRKEYPANLSKLLGYALRLEKNTIESMKIDLPPKTLLEVDQSLLEDDTGRNSFKESQNTLNKIVKDVQLQTTKMSRLSEALEIVNNNPLNPWDGYEEIR